jgi:RNA polymerase sigma-70 factor (ECF subfamily)
VTTPPDPHTLTALVDAACSAWPSVSVPRALLEERLRAAAEPARVHAADLALALSCAHGAAGANEAFAKTWDARIEQWAASVDTASAKDTAQAVRTKLLVKIGDEPPRIAAYDGTGAMASWLRVVTTREALSGKRKVRREVLDDEELFERASNTTDPELHIIKQKHAGDFKKAFVASLADLSPRQRNLLRHHYVDGSTLAQIGALYGVHKGSAGRWLEDARAVLLEGTRARLHQALGASSGELDSLLRLVQTGLDLRLAEALGKPEDTSH